MGERKGQQKYYPPDFDWRKHSSINQYHGQHPLRERAAKLKTEGIMIVRFEMPYNVYCLSCKNHIGKGVRYNARKKHTDKYFSTKIFTFRFKCHLCDNWMEMRTDPEKRDYTIVSGMRKAVEEFDPSQLGTVQLDSEEKKAKLEADPFYRLEHEVEDARRGAAALSSLQQLIDLKDTRSKDDYAMHRALRRPVRSKRKKVKAQRNADKKAYPSMDVELLAPSSEDIIGAKSAHLRGRSAKISEEKRLRSVRYSSIFAKSPVSAYQSKKGQAVSTLMHNLRAGAKRKKFT